MFALEIDFHDGISPPETVLVRRPHAIVGASEQAHVVIEGGALGKTDLALTRIAGRDFLCRELRRGKASVDESRFIDGIYSNELEVNLGEVTTRVIALDVDLRMHADDVPDIAGVRTLRQAWNKKSPEFPAVMVFGAAPIVLSFQPDSPLLVGRSRECGLRLDAEDVSGEHALIGFDGESFWVEDLGSTNGSFINGERVQGRQTLSGDERVRIGETHELLPIANREVMYGLSSEQANRFDPAVELRSYPCLTTECPLVQPSQYILSPGQEVCIGRDPANEIWIGATHVSRKHLTLTMTAQGAVRVTDMSVNGTMLDDELMELETPMELSSGLHMLNFGGGVSIGLCFDAEAEGKFDAIVNEKTKEKDLHLNLDEISASTSVNPAVTEADLERIHAHEERLNADEAQVFRELARRPGNRAANSSQVASNLEGALGTTDEGRSSGVNRSFKSSLSGVRLVFFSGGVILLITFFVVLCVWLFAGSFLNF